MISRTCIARFEHALGMGLARNDFAISRLCTCMLYIESNGSLKGGYMHVVYWDEKLVLVCCPIYITHCLLYEVGSLKLGL